MPLTRLRRGGDRQVDSRRCGCGPLTCRASAMHAQMCAQLAVCVVWRLPELSTGMGNMQPQAPKLSSSSRKMLQAGRVDFSYALASATHESSLEAVCRVM